MRPLLVLNQSLDVAGSWELLGGIGVLFELLHRGGVLGLSVLGFPFIDAGQLTLGPPLVVGEREGWEGCLISEAHRFLRNHHTLAIVIEGHGVGRGNLPNRLWFRLLRFFLIILWLFFIQKKALVLV